MLSLISPNVVDTCTEKGETSSMLARTVGGLTKYNASVDGKALRRIRDIAGGDGEIQSGPLITARGMPT